MDTHEEKLGEKTIARLLGCYNNCRQNHLVNSGRSEQFMVIPRNSQVEGIWRFMGNMEEVDSVARKISGHIGKPASWLVKENWDIFRSFGRKKNDVKSRNLKLKDNKYDYARSMMALIGIFVQMIESVKEGDGLSCFLLQKKVHKIIQGSGHKNYACSIASFKQIVLGHKSPKFSHAYMWNISAGRPGSGLKMARDQRVEHLNRFLKEGFKSLGVNLDEKNAKRINNGADIEQKIKSKVNEFYSLDGPGKSHKKKDRTLIVRKLTELFKNEKVAIYVPKRDFNGPEVLPSLENSYDEA